MSVERPVSVPGDPAHVLTVASAEAEMKLLRFLQCRLRDDLPLPVLHKWIRSGQVRVNGGRVKPFVRLAGGDVVRLPPFAAPVTASVGGPGLLSSPGFLAGSQPASGPLFPLGSGFLLGPGLEIVAVSGDLLVLHKSAGLSCHPGSAPARRAPGAPAPDSVSARLRAAFAACPYIPAPAHRLDRRTSGLLLAGLTYARARCLHSLFRRGGIAKYYLAWVRGRVPWTGARILEDRTEKKIVAGRERVCALPEGNPDEPPPCSPVGDTGALLFPRGREGLERGRALCAALVLGHLEAERLPPGLCAAFTGKAGEAATTLLLLRPLTGFKHQLRAQLAARAFPLIGDPLYGGPPFPDLLLHAYALRLPPHGGEEGNAPELFVLPPPWGAPFVPDAAGLLPADLLPDAI
ncbi:MAG: hypothetical protein LBQ51_08155 [Desulfovibrio sp.]|nr:hypothetical protein [Desulfovibrio sp.]